MKETVNIKINQLPSKTWHWLKLNETNFAWTDEAQEIGRASCRERV